MASTQPDLANAPDTLPRMPPWVISARAETLEDVAFLSGALFAMLDMALIQSGEAVPKCLLANTLALKAAVATSKLEGRLAREADIRDAYYLTPPDAGGVRNWGPDGDVLAFWRRAVRIRLDGLDWMRTIADHIDAGFADAVEGWLTEAMAQAATHGPVLAVTDLLRTVLYVDDRAERIACQLADVALAKFFGWKHPLPLTALHLTKGDLRELISGAGETDAAVQSALNQSAQSIVRMASTLAARAAALQAVAPKLRAKGSDAAINLFLTEDAVAPSGMLSPHIHGTTIPMTGRAARRLCHRLVELGVAKELTGRSTFRLYGMSP